MRTSNKDRKAWMLSVRTSNELRAKLQSALEQSGRTLTQEVEMRLERSFATDEYVGGQRTAAFLDVLGTSIREIQLKNGQSWLSNHETWQDVADLSSRLLAERRPQAESLQSGTQSNLGRNRKAKGINLYGD